MPIAYNSHREELPRGGNIKFDNKRVSDGSEYSLPPPDQVDVLFQSVLRLRPLSRKEREDHVVLEGIPASSKDAAATAVLHPFASEEAVVVGTSLTNRTIQRGLETEYHFNHFLPVSADQDKAYYMIGLPMALSAMEPLKTKSTNNGDLTSNVKTHLVLCMGPSNAGKTYTAFGKGIGKRRTSDDGLVPRILDSLFSQSKHHTSSSSKHANNGNGQDVFGVRISLLQVDASSSSSSTSPDDSIIRDLFQQENVQANGGVNPVRSRSVSPMSRQRSIQSVKAMIASFEQHGGDGGDAIGAVRIVQDETTKDFRVVNATIQTCRDVSEAREVLQQGLARKKRGPFGKTIKGHTLVTLQPVLSDPRNGNVQQHGGMLAILDMSSSKRKGSLNGRSAAPMKDNMADSSTLSAVMHCLRTLQYNANLRAGRSPAIDIVNDDDISVDASEISCVSDLNKDSYPSQQRQPRLKMVPYRQSKLTMLLQPFFSPRLVETTTTTTATTSLQTIVTILLAAYPGHRDYTEKKSFLNDLELLHGLGLTSERQQRATALPPVAMTGLENEKKLGLQQEQQQHQQQQRPTTCTVTNNNKDSDPMDDYRMLGKRSFSNDSHDSVDYDPLPEVNHAVNTQNRHHTVEQPVWIQHTTMPYHSNANAPPSTLMETDSLALSESMDDEDAVGHPPPPSAPLLATPPDHYTKVLIHGDKTRTALLSSHAPAMPAKIGHNVSSPPLSRTTPMDFPGVELPATSTKPTATATESAGATPMTSRSPNRQVHFSAQYPSTTETTTRFIGEPQVITTKSSTPKTKQTDQRKEDKSKSPAIPWLSNSSPMKSINKVVNASRMTGIKVLEKMTRDASSPVDMHPKIPLQPSSSTTPSRHHVVSSPVVPSHRSNEFDVQDSATKEALMRKIQYLEDHNKDLMKELGEIATRCAKLEEEKNALAHQLREAHRRRLDTDWTALDEQEWQQSRKHRIDQQQLIRSPLQHHLSNVQSTFQMKNQWLESGKAHFELCFPGNFRRASALDRRDKAAAAAAATASETVVAEEGERQLPPRTPLSSIKKRLSQDGTQTGSNRKRLQLFQQLIDRENRKRGRQGRDN